MGVFDGGMYEVSCRRKDGGEEDTYTDDPGTLVETLRADPDVVAVATCWVHFVTGEQAEEFSFGDFWGYEEEDA